MPVAFLLFIVAAIVVVAVASTRVGHVIGAAAEHFLLYYAGVFALISLTAAVGIGLVATDRIIMSPASRVTAQAVHRAVSFGAVSFLAIHIASEILARRSHAVDAVLPFLDHRRTLYLGLGTVASDLLVLIAVTGILRRRFAETSPPWVWRLLHALAYVAWPMGIWHGLLSGRHSKPYVDWSYGGLVAVVGVALLVRLVAKDRSGQTAGQPVPERLASPWPPAAGAAALGQAGFGTARLAIPSGAVPVGRPQQRALPAGTGAQVTADLPDRGQVVDRAQFAHDDAHDDAQADFAYDDPRGHFHQDDQRWQYRQADPGEYIRADDPREYIRPDDPRGHFHQDDQRWQYRPADPGEYIRPDDPRERFRQDEAPAFENDSADYEETGPLPAVPYSRYGTRS
jgi:DMSO/TMAO reductase YedYZ heme-binding membrane subunit